MRFRFLLCTLALLGLSFASQAQPKIDFEKKNQKFEKVKADTTISFDFFYFNTGDQPLIITDIKVSCDCTVPTFTQEPVFPGKREKVHVTFDTRGKIGYQDRILYVHGNMPNSPVKIRFKGMVDHKGTVKQ